MSIGGPKLTTSARCTVATIITTALSFALLSHATPSPAAAGRVAIGGSWGTGYVGLLARNGMPRERLLDPQLADPDVLRKYGLVVVAGSVTNWGAAEQAIATYVSEGGSALLECTALPTAATLPGTRTGAQAAPNFLLEGNHPAIAALPAGKTYTHNGYSAAAITPDAASGATILARFTDAGASDKVKGKFVINGQGAASLVHKQIGQGHLIYSGPWMAYGMAFGRDYSDLVFSLVSFLTGGEVTPRLTLAGDNAMMNRAWDEPATPGEAWAEAPLPEGYELIENPGEFGDYCLIGTLNGAAGILLDYRGEGKACELSIGEGGSVTLALPDGETPIAARIGAIQPGAELMIVRRAGSIRVTIGGEHVLTTADRGNWPGGIASKALGEPMVQPIEPVVYADDFMRKAGEAGDWQVVSGNWQVVSSEGAATTGANPFSYGIEATETAVATAGQWFWTDYSAETSVRWTQNVAGLAFHYSDASNYDLLEADQAAQTLRLVAIRDGARTVLDEAPVELRPWQWCRLGVRASGGTVVGLLDSRPLLEVSGLAPSTGGIGILAANTKAAFDDVTVRDWHAFAAPLSGEPATWRAMSGAWQNTNNALTARGDGATRAPGEWTDLVATANVKLGKAEGAGIRLVGDDDSAATIALSTGKGALTLKLMTREGTGGIVSLKNLKPSDSHELSVRRAGDCVSCSVDGKPVLVRATKLPKKVWVELTNTGKVGAEYRDIGIESSASSLFPTDPPTPAYAGAVDVMTWAGPAFSWLPDPTDLSRFWHEGSAPGDARLKVGVHKAGAESTTANLLLAPEASTDGYAATFTHKWGGDVVAVALTKAGTTLAQASQPGVSGDAFLAEVERVGPALALRVNGQTVLTHNDVDSPIDCRRAGVRIEGATLCYDDLHLERSHARNYTFTSAPTDWLVQNGTWEVTSRWTCSPGWTWLSGLDVDHALVQSKWQVQGDVSLDAYVGAKMMNTPAGRKEVLQDFRLGICGKPGYLNAGYYFLIGAKGGQYTALQRNGLIVAEADSFAIPQGSVHNDWLRLGIEKTGGRVSLLCQGQPVLTYDDPDPLPGGAVCIGAYDNGIMVPRVTVHGDVRQ